MCSSDLSVIANIRNTTTAPVPMSVTTIDYEGFTSGFGSWVQATFDTDDWLRGTSTPSTGTGPQSTYDGTFAYVETSSGECNAPDTAVLYLSPPINFDDYDEVNVSFAYNMYGSTMGTLNIKENTTGSWVTKWSLSADQNSVWHVANVNIGGVSGSGSIAVWMDCGASYTSDAAVDSINVTGLIGAVAGSSKDQVAYESGIGWQANITVPSGLSGLQDLTLNISYLGTSYLGTETDSLSYPVTLYSELVGPADAANVSSPVTFSTNASTTSGRIMNATLWTNESGWAPVETRWAGEIPYNDTGLVGLWHLNKEAVAGETSTVAVDWAGGESNGAVTNSPVWNASGGYFGPGYQFISGSSQYIDLGTPDELINLNTSDFTISAWVRLTDNSADHDIVGYGYTDTYGAFELRYDVGDNMWEFDTTDTVGWQYAKYSQASPSLNTWTHVVAVLDQTEIGRAHV